MSKGKKGNVAPGFKKTWLRDNMDLKILMVTPFFPPTVNGTSLYVYHLVKGLMSHGIHTLVHTIERNPSRKVHNLDLKLDNLDVISFRGLFDLRGSSDDQPISLSYATSTLKICDDFDVIHIHDSPKVCNDILILTMKKLKTNKPVIFTPHGGFVSSPAYKWAEASSLIYKLFSRLYWSLGIPKKSLQIADHLIAVSSSQAKLFSRVCGSRKVSLIPEAVPSYYFVDKPTFIDDEKLKILFIGRMAERKGIKNLLYATHQIAEKPKVKNEVEVVCIGPDFGYLQEALKIVSELKLDGVVRMLGALPEHEKMKHLGWCDILVLPSYYEAFGLPILEAMAQGKPVIATETVGAKSLVKHGETGFLVKIGDVQGIAYALRRFLRSPKLKYQMGERALKYASKFRMENMIEDHIRVYENLTGLHN